jgi:probable HAF family extracellular repeat protein
MAAAACISTPAAADPPVECTAHQYTVIALPLVPTAIADNGTVAGNTHDFHAATWTEAGQLQVIPLPGGYSTAEAITINQKGHVAGNAHDNTLDKSTAFLFAHDKLTVLNGTQPRISGINDADVVVGEALGPNGKTMQPASWTHNVLKPLTTCCGGSLAAINNQGMAVGTTYDERSQYHAFLWTQTDGLKQIGPPDKYSTAITVNDRGHAVIQSFPAVFLYDGQNLETLVLHKKHLSKPYSMNNCDVIVGAFGPVSEADRAFIWSRPSGFLDLNKQIPKDSGWKLKAATGINNHGVIVGKGDLNSKPDFGFMLMPTPDAATPPASGAPPQPKAQ